jgi:putative membrane protein
VKSQDLERLADGATKYQEKIVELAGGIDRLSDGSKALSEGLYEINEGLSKFASSIPDGKEKAESLAVSVESERIDLVSAPVNGAAFAPYFMGLSLWIGGITISFLFRSIVFPRSVADKSRLAKIIGKWMAPFLISSVSAITLGLYIHLVLKVPISDEVGYYAILIMAVLTTSGFILSLISLIGDAGKLVCLIFLVIQISAVGGAFPLATQPHFYQLISPYLPMTNIVFGLRAAMFGSFDGNWQIHVLSMLPWLCISLTLGLVASRRFNYVDDDQYGPALDMSFIKHNKN